MTFKDPDALLVLFRQVQAVRSPYIESMMEIRDVYNDDKKLPLPELDKNERPAVPNLLEQGLDGMANRVTSTMPMPRYFATKPGQPRAEERARTRKLATLGWWEQNDMSLIMKRRTRHFLGYACAPVMIRPSPASTPHERRGPRWHVRDPLTTYPLPTTGPWDMRPPGCFFAYDRSWAWVRTMYPEAANAVERPDYTTDADEFEILEYVDDTEISLFVIGKRSGSAGGNGQWGYGDGHARFWVAGGARTVGMHRIVPLERIENRAGVPLVIIPERLTLDKPKGNYDGMVGMYMMQSKLFALEYIAVEQGVFPDEWAMSPDPNIQPEIVTMADGRQGVIGRIIGGEIKATNHQPGYMTTPTINYLERAQRLTGGIPAEMGGESPSNVRTGRRGNDVLSAAIDFTIQDTQQTFEVSLRHEDDTAIEVDKTHFGNQPKSFYVNWKGARGQVDYTPNDLFADSGRHDVRYAFAGVDQDRLIIGLGQRRGLESISMETFLEHDPMIEEPDVEMARLASESLTRAFWASIDQGIVNGTVTGVEVARIKERVARGDDPMTAYLEIHAEVQQAQATSGPPGTPEGPAPPGSPEAQPGLGSPANAAAVGPVAPAAHDFAAQLGALFPAQAALARTGTG